MVRWRRRAAPVGRNRGARRVLVVFVIRVVMVTASTSLFVGAGFFVAQERRHATVIASPATRRPAVTLAASRTAAAPRMMVTSVTGPTIIHLRVVRRGPIHVVVRLVTSVDWRSIVTLIRARTGTVGGQHMAGFVRRRRRERSRRRTVFGITSILMGSTLVVFLPFVGRHNDVLRVRRRRVGAHVPIVSFL